jgi:hypothetical protein
MSYCCTNSLFGFVAIFWKFEICALLQYYAACSCNSLPTFRDNLSVPSSRVKKSRKFFSRVTLLRHIRCAKVLVLDFGAIRVIRTKGTKRILREDSQFYALQTFRNLFEEFVIFPSRLFESRINFIVASGKSILRVIIFWTPTHGINIPKNYTSTYSFL